MTLGFLGFFNPKSCKYVMASWLFDNETVTCENTNLIT